MKRTVVAFVAMLFAVEVTQASVLHVGFGGYAPYTDIQSAITAAAPGDTIVISPNVNTYGGFSVNKRLVILGAGSSPAGVYTKVSSVDVTDAGDSTTIASLWVVGTSTIRSGARGVIVRDCLMEYRNCSSSMGGCYPVIVLQIDSTASVTAVRCCLWGSYGCPECPSYYVCILGNNANLALIGCILCSGYYAIVGGNQGAQLTISHCVFQHSGVITSANGTVENSAFLSGLGGATNLITQYSAFAGTPPAGTGNITLTTTDFVNIVTNDPVASDYHLSPESPLRDAGNPSSPLDGDGSRADIGVYSGANPYSPAGIPGFPFVTGLEVPAVVPQNGVLEIHSTGRVGSGN